MINLNSSDELGLPMSTEEWEDYIDSAGLGYIEPTYDDPEGIFYSVEQE